MAMSALKVTPAQLKSKAKEFDTQAGKVKKTTQQMFDIIKELTGAVWSGVAATKYKGQFNKLNDDVQRMLKMIKEFSSDLLAIAAEYEKAEKANEAAAASLKTDVIQY